MFLEKLNSDHHNLNVCFAGGVRLCFLILLAAPRLLNWLFLLRMNVEHAIRICVWSRARKFFPMTNQTVHFPYPEGGRFLPCTSHAFPHVHTHSLLMCVLCARLVSSLRDKFPVRRAPRWVCGEAAYHGILHLRFLFFRRIVASWFSEVCNSGSVTIGILEVCRSLLSCRRVCLEKKNSIVGRMRNVRILTHAGGNVVTLEMKVLASVQGERGSLRDVGSRVGTSPHLLIDSNHEVFTMLLVGRVCGVFLACRKSLFCQKAVA